MEVGHGGSTGHRMQHVNSKREPLVGVLGDESRASGSELHRAFVAVCAGLALVIVERVPAGGGLEAWWQLRAKNQAVQGDPSHQRLEIRHQRR